MLDSNKVPVSQSALLVIDAQDSFKLGARWERRSNPAFEKNVTQLIEAYRAAHLPVVFFLHTDKDQGFARDSPSFKLMDFLKPRGEELGVDAICERTEYALRRRFARITTVNQLTKELEAVQQGN